MWSSLPLCNLATLLFSHQATLLVNDQAPPAQFYVRMFSKRLDNTFETLVKQSKQVVVADIAGRKQKKFVWFASNQMRVDEISILCDENPLLTYRQLVDNSICCPIANGRSSV
jgi:hypothetical protein